MSVIIGGNAKTLMFVNVSPADYNTDETIQSLTYASRVKMIKNDVSKGVETKEIKKYKDRIKQYDDLFLKIKSGEKVNLEDLEKLRDFGQPSTQEEQQQWKDTLATDLAA
eukprot:TRINITY_DN2090_c0_g2_i7.p1 TRINITY_DN2090_c0_g2~~TRINITY_DN2090_c0_g2_i7.p1  ORF type:complete len:110 (-),score=22.52 TRINITY_DN2090_c0_g2_i7:138-467(-)